MAIDYSSNVGKLRLRVGDVSDLPFLPDEVYEQTLADFNNNLPKSAAQCANYILAMLSFKTHRKLQSLEVWGAEAFNNYRLFLRETINNPNALNGAIPIPYDGNSADKTSPLAQFVKDWNNAYSGCTQSEVLHELAIINRPDQYQ